MKIRRLCSSCNGVGHHDFDMGGGDFVTYGCQMCKGEGFTTEEIDKPKYEMIVLMFPYMFSCPDKRRPFPMFGFECGIGWWKIIYDLCFAIDELLTDEDKKTFYVTQVKEKFGGLRFYTSWDNDNIDKAICKAEDLADVTCERCGAPGVLRSYGGWLRTRCDSCWEKFLERREKGLYEEE